MTQIFNPKTKADDWLVHLDRVTLRVRDRRLLKDTDWVIGPNHHWAVIGPNGAGKSTLVGALAGEVPVVGGKIRFNPDRLVPDQVGYVCFEHHRRLIAREERRGIARSFSRNFNFQTVQQILRPAATWDGTSSDTSSPIVDRLGMNDLLDRPLRHLSNGEFRKVLIARELLRAPRLLILDEPFEGLDPATRRDLMNGFERWTSPDTRLVLVTHRLDEISDFFTHVLAVRDGRVVYQAGRNSGMQRARIEKVYAEAERNSDARLPVAGRRLCGKPTFAGSLVEMKNVTVAFGSTVVLQNLSWIMNAGENWAVTGPNGCGKSTLLKLIVGDHPQAYANEIRLFGRRKGSGENIWDIKRRIGYLSPEFQIHYRKSVPVLDVVLSGFFDSVGLYRRCSAAQRATAESWMDRLGVSHLAGRGYATLSQGEQRRILLARAMIKDPLLLILDEPCHGLDRNARQVVLTFIDQLGRRPETHLIYVSHHWEEAPPCITHELRFRRCGEEGYRYASMRNR